MNLICNKCGENFNHHRRRKSCLKCVPERNTYTSKEEQKAARKKQIVANVQRRREKVKDMAIEYKGGSCQICGYDKCNRALEFHHLDPLEKDFGISSKGYTRSWNAIKEELDKCIMVCANCHREIHDGIVEYGYVA